MKSDLFAQSNLVVQPSEGPAYHRGGGGNGGQVAGAAIGGGILRGILS